MEHFQDGTSIDIFISHRRSDEKIAEALIELLRSAIVVQPQRIRCSSVQGYRLPGGVSIDDQLRQELLDSRVFVAVITRESLKSEYLLFELGARWGSNRKLIPLLAAGMNPNELKAPLRGLQILSCDKELDLNQLVAEISTALGLALAQQGVYARYIKDLKELSQREASIRRRGSTQVTRRIADRPKDLKAEESIRRVREGLTLDNRKREWRPIARVAGIARMPEDETLRLLRTMHDVELSTNPHGERIARKKSFRW